MLEVPVYNLDGQKIETLQIDEQRFGGEVNIALLKQAVVAYHTNTHQGSAATKDRSQIEGSGRKLFRQKGTGNARRGPIRSPIMRGGGRAFAKTPHKVRHNMSKKMRIRALNSALLAKMLGADMMVVDGLKLDAPKTKVVATMLGKLEIKTSCLLTIEKPNDIVYRSTRNIPRISVMTVADLNAFDVVNRRKMLLTRAAMETLLQGGR